jgi:hypothetical protein
MPQPDRSGRTDFELQAVIGILKSVLDDRGVFSARHEHGLLDLRAVHRKA